MTKQELLELKEKAREATPGPWFLETQWTPPEFGIGDGARISIIRPIKWAIKNGSSSQINDFEHIAAANPQVVLDLIERLEGMQEALIKVHAMSHTAMPRELREFTQEALEKYGVK